MDTHFRRPTLVLGLACLLAVLLFPLVMATPGAHFWARYLLPITVVFLWGRRRDIYLVTALCSVLLVAGYWFGDSSGPDDLVVNHVLPLAVLWAAAWLLAQYQRIQEEWAAQRQKLLRTEQQHEHLVAMIENSPDRIWSVDREYRLLVGNSAFARGVTMQIGRPLALGECVLDDPFPPGARALWQPLYDRAFGGESFTVQIPSHLGHGTVLECRLNPIYDAAGGTIAGAAARAVDITARIETETRVHETLARLQLATDAAEIGVWNWNFADGSVEWDERTCELYAVPPDARQAGLYYDTWRARVHPDDLAQADPAQGNPEQVPPRWSGTYRIVLPGGAIRHVQSSAVTQYAREGRPLRMIGVVRDVTDQVRYDQLLQDANAELEQRVAQRTADLQAALAELQAANRLKDEFMAMISHELRTPLTGVLSLSELLAEQVAGPLNERQARYVRGINESGERLLYVINNILSYTHLVAGKVQLQREPCDLGYVVHVCAVSQRAKAETKQQAIEELVEPAGLSVESDAEALCEVLKRLLDNAIKYTPAGGQVGVVAQGGRQPGTVQLVVWDRGPGLAGEQLQQLVKPFAQGDGSLARGYEGIGMGLAYVNQMVRLLDGTLAVAPNPGGGSRFTITLPAGNEAVALAQIIRPRAGAA